MQNLKNNYFLQQVYQLAFAALTVRYRRTYFGLIWVILNPILILIVQSIVFNHVLNVKIDHYFLYLVSGLLPWLFISQTLEMGTAQLRSQALTIKAFFIKPHLLTISLVLENIVNLLITMLLTLLPLYLYYNKSVLLLPLWALNIIPLAIGIFAFAFVFSSLNILFRDLRYLISFLLSITYFITPIFYTRDLIPADMHWLIDYNPLYILLAPFQAFALGLGVQAWALLFFKALALSISLLVLSYLHWKNFRNSFYLNL